jgi:hypothetical protein
VPSFLLFYPSFLVFTPFIQPLSIFYYLIFFLIPVSSFFSSQYFSFLMWRIASTSLPLIHSTSNKIKLKSSFLAWKNLKIAINYRNRKLLERVLYGFRELVWVRKNALKCVLSTRRTALLIATRMRRITGLALKESFLIWQAKTKNKTMLVSTQ